MNIQFQICGLSILFLLILFYKSHKTLQLYKERVFYAVLRIITVSLMADVLSLAAIRYRQSMPLLLVETICKSYIVTLIWGAWSALIYVLTDIVTEKKHKKITGRFILLLTAQSLIVYLLPIYIYENGNQVYTYGPSIIWVYICVALYIIATVTITCVYRKKINPRIRFAIVLWMLIWMASAVIQFLNSALLIVGFASAIGVMILFVIMENPERNLERRLGCFNSYALTEYLNQLFERKKRFAVMEISFENISLLEGQGMEEKYESVRKILHLLDRFDDILIFKNINLSLVLISENAEELEAAGKVISDEFMSRDGLRREEMLILTERPDTFEDMNELFQFLSFVHTECGDETGKLIHADEELLKKFKEKSLIKQEIGSVRKADFHYRKIQD